MGKPTTGELQTAIKAAVVMRESGNDPDFVAKSLLSLNYRMEKMEKVLMAAKRYLHAGQSMSEHRALALAIQTAEKAEHIPADDKSIPSLMQH